jgi:hypothetical protein
VLVAVCLALVPVAGAGFTSGLLAGLAIVAVASLLVGLLLEWSALIAWAAAVLGLEYLLGLASGGAGLDARAAVFGAALLLMTECAFWSVELRTPLRDEGAVHAARGRAIAAMVMSGAAVAVVPLIAAGMEPDAGLFAPVLGAAAVVAIIGIMVRLGASS